MNTALSAALSLKLGRVPAVVKPRGVMGGPIMFLAGAESSTGLRAVFATGGLGEPDPRDGGTRLLRAAEGIAPLVSAAIVGEARSMTGFGTSSDDDVRPDGVCAAFREDCVSSRCP